MRSRLPGTQLPGLQRGGVSRAAAAAVNNPVCDDLGVTSAHKCPIQRSRSNDRDFHLGDEVGVCVILQLHELRKLLIKQAFSEQLRDEGLELRVFRHDSGRGNHFRCDGCEIEQRGAVVSRRSSISLGR